MYCNIRRLWPITSAITLLSIKYMTFISRAFQLWVISQLWRIAYFWKIHCLSIFYILKLLNTNQRKKDASWLLKLYSNVNIYIKRMLSFVMDYLWLFIYYKDKATTETVYDVIVSHDCSVYCQSQWHRYNPNISNATCIQNETQTKSCVYYTVAL